MSWIDVPEIHGCSEIKRYENLSLDRNPVVGFVEVGRTGVT